ncbi:MAG: NAD(P)-dependent oxidoreductase [Opitutae bacterium]|jgi:nucleoside-diphosphate-sugar epimerase|nr:NAD(P)-dependent oxidoreductase [Opitutae bacterium]
MRVLLTGGSGFVGQYVLSRLISTKLEILATSSPLNDQERIVAGNLRWLQCDLSEPPSYSRSIIEFEPDVVIHLAWQGIPNYSAEISGLNLRNSASFLNLVATETACTQLVIAGSCMEYQRDWVSREIDAFPRIGEKGSFLAWAKNSLRDYCFLLGAEKGMNVAWLRIFYVYGSGQRAGALIPTLISAATSGTGFELKNPENQNDFVYVKDVAEAIVLATMAESSINGIYDVGSGNLTAIRDICSFVEHEITGKTSNKSLMSKKGIGPGGSVNIEPIVADLKGIKKELDWEPEWKLEDGIRETINLHLTTHQSS